MVDRTVWKYHDERIKDYQRKIEADSEYPVQQQIFKTKRSLLINLEIELESLSETIKSVKEEKRIAHEHMKRIERKYTMDDENEYYLGTVKHMIHTLKGHMLQYDADSYIHFFLKQICFGQQLGPIKGTAEEKKKLKKILQPFLEEGLLYTLKRDGETCWYRSC